MGTVSMQASMSLDGFIADPSDGVGPLFDWYGNGYARSPLLLEDPRVVQGERVMHLRYRLRRP